MKFYAVLLVILALVAVPSQRLEGHPNPLTYIYLIPNQTNRLKRTNG